MNLFFCTRDIPDFPICNFYCQSDGAECIVALTYIIIIGMGRIWLKIARLKKGCNICNSEYSFLIFIETSLVIHFLLLIRLFKKCWKCNQTTSRSEKNVELFDKSAVLHLAKLSKMSWAEIYYAVSFPQINSKRYIYETRLLNSCHWNFFL